MDDLSEEVRLAELYTQLEKDNQKPALTEEVVTKLLLDDILKGYTLIVSTDCMK